MRFGQLTKAVALLVGAQLVCLTLGLWIHYCFIVSSSQWSAEEQVWDRLGQTARQLAPRLAATGPSADAVLPTNFGALAIDRQGRVQWTHSPQGDQSFAPGSIVDWRPLPGVGPDASGPQRVQLHMPDGPRLAVVELAGRGPQRLVVYATSSAPASAVTILRALPAAGGVSLAWIGGLQAIAGYLILYRLNRVQTRAKAKADAEALRRTQDLVRTRDAIIFGLAKLAESRDMDTGHHLERISLYSTRLAAAMRRRPEFGDAISPAFVRLIGISSALHDIGKVGIRDAILLKNGPLTPAEFKHIQTHTTIGGDCLRMIERRLGESNFLEMAREIAISHHERWDGHGYPAQLAGAEIPLAARIVAIADVYDALSQRRIYRDPLPHEQCVAYIRNHAGTHFDPEVVEVFLQIESQFRELARKYAAHREALTRRQPESRDATASTRPAESPVALEVATTT